jgi:hypothetical protein
VPTAPDLGASDELDSDADPLTATTTFVAPAAGRVDLNFGLGVVRPARLTGTTFNDRNGNGTRDAGEEPLPGWVVFLDRDGDNTPDAAEPSQTVQPDGTFAFDNLGGGTYRVRVVPQDKWALSIPAASLDVPLRGGGAAEVGVGVHTAEPESRPVAATAPLRANSNTANAQLGSRVALDAAGNVVLVWTSNLQDGSASGVFGRLFDAAGAPRGADFRVNTTTAGDQWNGRVASDAAGDFVVVWQGPGVGQSDVDVFGQRFNAAGVKQGGEFRVAAAAGVQAEPDVAMDAAGNFVVVWRRNNVSGPPDLRLQRFDAAGNRVGARCRCRHPAGSTCLRCR